MLVGAGGVTERPIVLNLDCREMGVKEGSGRTSGPGVNGTADGLRDRFFLEPDRGRGLYWCFLHRGCMYGFVTGVLHLRHRSVSVAWHVAKNTLLQLGFVH